MSAAELLKQVKALPPAERRKFIQAIAALKKPTKKPARKPKAPKKVDWSGLEQRMKRIYGDRIMPNMVILERDERGF